MSAWDPFGIDDSLINWMSGPNPATAGMPYLNQIPDTLKQYLGPYSKMGMDQYPGLKDQYGQLMSNPGDMLSKFGQGYTQSPGYQFNVDQGMNAVGNAAAAGGMAGSPLHQFNAAKMVHGFADQDFNDYLSHVLGLYGQGLQGNQHLFDTGYHASSDLGQDLSQALGAQAQMASAGQESQNKSRGSIFGDIIGGLTSFMGGG